MASSSCAMLHASLQSHNPLTGQVRRPQPRSVSRPPSALCGWVRRQRLGGDRSKRRSFSGAPGAAGRNAGSESKLSRDQSEKRKEAEKMFHIGQHAYGKDVLRKWNCAEAVCFDVDSTVCLDEGIDELAKFCGAGEAVAALTSRAMVGTIPFEDALAARLDLIKPTRYAVDSYLIRNPPRISPGIKELVEQLQGRGTDVYLVSGGFRQMIDPIAAFLQIPRDNIFANRLLFGVDGQYIGFDAEEPTSRSGGKATVVSQIKQKYGYRTLVMVGDGATDLEARKPGGADIFICYGGVQLRREVAAAADWLILSFSDLINSLHESQLDSSEITNS